MLTALKALRVISGLVFAYLVYLNIMNYINEMPTDATYAIIAGVVFCACPSLINWQNKRLAKLHADLRNS